MREPEVVERDGRDLHPRVEVLHAGLELLDFSDERVLRDPRLEV